MRLLFALQDRHGRRSDLSLGPPSEAPHPAATESETPVTEETMPEPPVADEPGSEAGPESGDDENGDFLGMLPSQSTVKVCLEPGNPLRTNDRAWFQRAEPKPASDHEIGMEPAGPGMQREFTDDLNELQEAHRSQAQTVGFG